MDTVVYYTIRIAASLGVAFVVNVVLVALKAPKWSYPLGWAAWFGERCGDIGGWFGKQFGRPYVWCAQVLTDCLEHIVPALRQSTRDLLLFILTPIATLAEFFSQLWTTLCNSPYVGALGDFIVSPLAIYIASALAFTAALIVGHSYYPQYWARLVGYFGPLAQALVVVVLIALVIISLLWCSTNPAALAPPHEPAVPMAPARRNPPRRAPGANE